MKKNSLTYTFICFSELVYEFSFSDAPEIEKKIKRRLKYYSLGDYDQETINYIRALRSDLFEEISLRSKSKYFVKSNSEYADLEDFDIERMQFDYQKKYDRLSKEDLLRILNFSVYVFYMR